MGLFDGSSAKTFSFTNPGDWVEGTVVGWEERQRTAFGTQEPMWWDAEKSRPKMQGLLTLKTSLREDADDDGLRTVYLRRSGTSTGGIESLGKAMKNAGVPKGPDGIEPEDDAYVRMEYIGDDRPKTPGMNGAKQYRAEYRRPARTTGMFEDADDGAPEAF